MRGDARPAWLQERQALATALGDTPICDGLLPWTRAFLPPGADLGGLLGQFWAAGIDHVSVTVAAGRDDADAALRELGALRRELVLRADDIAIVSDREAVRAAKSEGRLSVGFHFQTATPFVEDMDLVDAFAAAGVGRAILAYNEANPFADGCHEARNAGLSALGRRLLARMDAAGMIVDLSHCGERTAFEALEAPLTRAPVFSHSNARALFEHERNISDDLIRACGQRGGTIGISGVGFFLGVGGEALPDTMAAHAAHVAELIGTEHLTLGLDFMLLEGSDYGFFYRNRETWPRGYPDPPWHFFHPERLGDLVDALESKGFGTDEIAGILGKNYLRSMLPD